MGKKWKWGGRIGGEGEHPNWGEGCILVLRGMDAPAIIHNH